MIRNLGQADRILRLVAGIIVAVIAWIYGGAWPVLGPVLWIVASVLILTATFTRSPVCRVVPVHLPAAKEMTGFTPITSFVRGILSGVMRRDGAQDLAHPKAAPCAFP